MTKRTAGVCTAIVLVAAILRMGMGHAGLVTFDLQLSGWTGVALLAIVAWQLRMPLLRIRKIPVPQASLMTHFVLGMVGPLLLALHTNSFGYGYTWLLAGAFLGSYGVGAWLLLVPGKTARSRRLQQGLHTFIASLFVPLLFAHILITLYFE